MERLQDFSVVLLAEDAQGELGDALTYALGAGQLFNVDEGSEYVDTLLAKAIDEYCGLHVARYERAVKAERGGEVEAEPLRARAMDRANFRGLVREAVSKPNFARKYGV